MRSPEFAPGTFVRLRTDPIRAGILQPGGRIQANRRMVPVHFPDASVSWLPETALVPRACSRASCAAYRPLCWRAFCGYSPSALSQFWHTTFQKTMFEISMSIKLSADVINVDAFRDRGRCRARAR